MDSLPARPLAPDNYAGSPQQPQAPPPVYRQPPVSPGTPYDRINGATTQPRSSRPPQQYPYSQQHYQYHPEHQYHPQSPHQQSPRQQQQQQQQQEEDTSHLPASVGSPTRPPKFTEEWDASPRGSSIMSGTSMQRSNSMAGSITGDASAMLSRGNTLKKRGSVRRSGSLRRSGSRRSIMAGSVRSLALQSTTDQEEVHSAFFCPVPTSGSPTDSLASRFQAWRKILKDLITYFREIQSHYESRSKSLVKLTNVLNNISTPPGFLASGGLDDALQILSNHNKQAIADSNKAREIEEDVILALTGLRSDLQQKIKEIKNLAGDFKNSVDKEMDNTRRAVNNLQDVLAQTEMDPALATGKQDPYLLRLAADRQLERQIDEENYLHQAYLNLEKSGRELESIVVGEIQKSYKAYAGILKREADTTYASVEDLRLGPISMPKDHEWAAFIARSDQLIDPDVPLRSAEFIQYPARRHYACQEIRAGLLERKGKYLKSYSPGWYVLSPTHLHEFKSADKTQAPVMSLYLPMQALGSHSVEGSSSNKFILKGRQTGVMHRGHTWVFRAESHDTMMAWYEDIKALTEGKTTEGGNNVAQDQALRSFSRTSQRSGRSGSSDGVVDEDDDVPFSAKESVSLQHQARPDAPAHRPSPGGRFPSDIEVNAQRGLQVPPLSPPSVSSESPPDHDIIAAVQALPGSVLGDGGPLPGATATTTATNGLRDSWKNGAAGGHGAPPTTQAIGNQYLYSPGPQAVPTGPQPGVVAMPLPSRTSSYRHAGPEAAAGPGQAGSGPEAAMINGINLQAGEQQQSQRPGVASYPSGTTVSGLSTDSDEPRFGQSQPLRTPAAATMMAMPRAAPAPVMTTGAMGNGVSAANGNGNSNRNTAKKPIGSVPNGRPVAPARNGSVPSTISNLHVPGEYPKVTPLA